MNTSQQNVLKQSRHTGSQMQGLLTDCGGLWIRLPLICEAESRPSCKHSKANKLLFLFPSKGRQFINIPHLNQASVQGKMLSSITAAFIFPWGFARWWSPNSRSWEQAVMSQACGFCIFSIARQGVYQYVSEHSVKSLNICRCQFPLLIKEIKRNTLLRWLSKARSEASAAWDFSVCCPVCSMGTCGCDIQPAECFRGNSRHQRA